jgi:adenine C2-methylase RlmN of 23S rRNA A2503 and tRNA A37
MMLHQVVDPILKGWISLKGIEHINIYTMGFGEPLANRETTRAIKLFLQHFEQAKLMVSTMGPPNGDKVFEELLALSIAHNNLDLQWSIHFLKDPERLAYSGMNKTNALMPLEEVAKRIRRWTNSTKRKVYANFGFGPKYAKWTEEYLNLLPSLFPPTDIIAKLSLEGPEGGDRWNLADFAAQISTFEPLFNNLGYETLIYSPPGIEEGGSCGAHALELADTDRLVWPIT